MAKKTTVPFNGTAEQEAKLYEIIDAHKDDPGALMPVLQQAQEVYGYLPIEVQKMISDKMGIPRLSAFVSLLPAFSPART